MEPNQERRRGHFHRGRRGADRRGLDRRAPSQLQPPQARDQIDVEQIMREIRARIAQRQGVELSHQQIDDLAARRLEYILDPRAMKPAFLDTLRRSADEVVEREEKRLPAEPVYVFEDTTLYDSHRAVLRFIRTLLNPLLKLFFNPNPLIRALHLQARLNVEAAERDAARDRRQAEWNALHYKIIQRLVTEVSRLSLEVQALSTRVESLGARVDFTDRRVRGVEGQLHQLRPAARPAETAAPGRPEAAPTREPAPETGQPEGGRRRRRRRRGRRGGAVPAEGAQVAAPPQPVPDQGPPRDAGAAGAEPGETAAAADSSLSGPERDERETKPVLHMAPPDEPPLAGPSLLADRPEAVPEPAPAAPPAVEDQATAPSPAPDHADRDRLE
jgi:hypothetical protein